MSYAQRLHTDLTSAGIDHTYENTGGGTMCAVVPVGDIVLVMGEDGPTVAPFFRAEWYGESGAYSEPYDVHEFDEDEYDEALAFVVARVKGGE